jgi:receptor protein-tyrosine kinase
MSVIEQATKRLEELKRAGVTVPGSTGGELQARLAHIPERAAEAAARAGTPLHGGPSAVVHRLEHAEPRAEAAAPTPARRSGSVKIDLDQLELLGYIVPSKARSEIAEQFRQIKRPLLKNVHLGASNPGSRNALIMVTSALAGEGKTFSAINLAMSIAMEIDTSVLLVDADVVRPSVPGRLGFQAGRGLLDVLQDPSIDVGEVMLRTNVPKLSVLPAGTLSGRSNELLASAAMEKLLVELSQRYSDRVIVFDAPPLLLTSEAQVLASRMGQVLMIVEGARTPRNTVAQAFAALENCPNVMSVLNRCQDPTDMRSYGYYY